MTFSNRTLSVDCRMFNMSGIGVYIKNLLPLCISNLPHINFQLIGSYANLDELTVMQNVTVSETNTPIYSIKEQIMLPRLATGDALWVPHFNIPLFCSIPLIVTVHDVIPLALPEIFGLAKRTIAKLYLEAVGKKAHKIFTVSQFTKRDYLKRVNTVRADIVTIPNGVNSSWFQPPQSPLPKGYPPRYIIAVGNIKKHKNIKILCESFASISHIVPHHLILVGKYKHFRSGEVDVAKLQSLAPERIHIFSDVSDYDLQLLVSHADFLAFPSYYEGFGLPLLEAMASGIPVLAADIPTSREVCAHAATYFPPHDQKALEQALLELCNLSKIKRNAKGKEGRQRAQKFTWNSAARVLSKELDSFLSNL